jgi:glycosyltransferase involved in cell wall biosynthesis
MIKVYLLVGKLPFYKDLINYPPDGVKYLNKADYGKDIASYYSSLMHTAKRKISSFLLKQLKMPRMTYVLNKECDLIHSNRGILILNRKPWLVDIDYVGYFFGENIFDRENLDRSILKKIVVKSLSSKYCKKIICWSNAAKASVNGIFKEKTIRDKAHVLYPAVPALKLEKKIPKDRIRLLYVSSSFAKGGNELLSAFQELAKKYDNIELFVKCDVPEEVKLRYNLKEIKYFPYKSQLLPRDYLIRNFHMASDIFIYPTLGDLFGLGLLDAMVASLPIVSTNTYAIPEIVEDGKGGFLINQPYIWYDKNYISLGKSKPLRKKTEFVEELVEKTSVLIEKPYLRKRMGKYNRKLVEKGKFSLGERNRKLKAIYEEAVG